MQTCVISLCIVCSLQDHHASKKLLLIVQMYCDHYINQHMLKHSEETIATKWYCPMLISQCGALPVTRMSITRSATILHMCRGCVPYHRYLITYDIHVSPQILVPYIDSACQHKFGSISFTFCRKG